LLQLAAAGAEPGVLDGDALALPEGEDLSPGQALAELAAAREDVRQAEEGLAVWTAGEWRPWAERWRAVAAGRALYRTLFDLRVRIEREGDLFELVWGFGRLRWQLGGERVDQPLLCTPVEVTMDTRSGRLEVAPAGPTVLDVSWSVDLPVRDRATLNRLREQLEDEEVDPWTPEAAGLLRPVLRAFDHDGVLVPPGQARPPVGEHAALDPGEWVLYVRRRQPNFRGFLDEQRRLYEAGAAVPDPFAALAVDETSPSSSDDPYAAGAGDSPGGPGPAGEEEPLLPLAVNEEQLQIVAMARSRAGVTAQGPPGTGKSHTIANLISHYVAHGKRVLVTAAKEQALGVLIDKVPEGIRQLCVPVLGSDAAARARLQATVTTIADAAHRRPDRSEIARLEADLAGLRARYAATTNTLKAKRAAETAIPPVPAPDADTEIAWTPSGAAAWVRRHPGLGWVPDRIGPDTPPPVTTEELAELVRHCAALEAADAEAAPD
ncbi:AAA family ATPase, partial [Acidimicrobiaceae bacterium USS-CC1]|nr:AAA family ATPase [Acidiferrimicrobium australe]